MKDRWAKGRYATKVTPAILEQMVQLRKEGASYNKIAASFGLSHQYARQLLTGERVILSLPATKNARGAETLSNQ